MLSVGFTVLQHALHIFLSFFVRRHAIIADDSFRTSIISCQGEGKAPAETVKEKPKMPDPSVNVVARIMDIRYSVQGCGIGRQLHQTMCAGPRKSTRIKCRFCLDDGFH